MDHDFHLTKIAISIEIGHNDHAVSLLRKSNLRNLEFTCVYENMEFTALKIRNSRIIHVRMIGVAYLMTVKEKSRKSADSTRSYHQELKDSEVNARGIYFYSVHSIVGTPEWRIR